MQDGDQMILSIRNLHKTFPKEDGEKVFEKTWDGRNDKGRNVSSGIYLLKVDINDHSEIVKIAKTK